MNIAIKPKDLSNDHELQKTMMKHYIHRNWKNIKKHSYKHKKGYNPEYVQSKVYDQMHVVIDIEIIKDAIKKVRYLVRKYKEQKKREKENRRAKKSKSRNKRRANKRGVDQGTQTEEIIYEMIN